MNAEEIAKKRCTSKVTVTLGIYEYKAELLNAERRGYQRGMEKGAEIVDIASVRYSGAENKTLRDIVSLIRAKAKGEGT